MIARLQLSLRKSAWLLALLIITSALPAHAQYDDPEVEMQEWLFKFEESQDQNGYIIIPKKGDGQQWDEERNEPYQLEVPSTRLLDGKPVVGLSGFESLKNLFEIIFPEECHVKYICDKCFQYCTSLGLNGEALNLPKSVETIGNSAFYECTNLKVVNLRSNLKSIGVSAFEKCKSLESITLPKKFESTA